MVRHATFRPFFISTTFLGFSYMWPAISWPDSPERRCLGEKWRPQLSAMYLEFFWISKSIFQPNRNINQVNLKHNFIPKCPLRLERNHQFPKASEADAMFFMTSFNLIVVQCTQKCYFHFVICFKNSTCTNVFLIWLNLTNLKTTNIPKKKTCQDPKDPVPKSE